MLAKRIIPCLDVDHGRVVKGKNFKNIKDVADPVELAKRYSLEGADELVFYDITASYEERDIFLNVVENVAKSIDIPFTIGGGVKSVDDFRKILLAGADKVSVNSSAVINPQLITDAARKFGSQCVVLSIDAMTGDNGSWDVYVKGGRENTHIDAVEWAKQGQKLGAGEICMNSMNTDGVKNGFDIELLKALNNVLTIPVIASGGAGTMQHFADALIEGCADAALAASVFHYNEIDIRQLKEYLKSRNISVRL